MKNYFWVFLLILIGGGSSNAVAAIPVGECVRVVDTVVCNMGYRAFNLKTFNDSWPQGTATLGELGLIFGASQRILNEEELAIINDTNVIQLPPPDLVEWVVHKHHPTAVKRPSYKFISGNLIEHKTLYATIGEPCGALAIPTTRTLQYRYLWKTDADGMTPYQDELGNHLVAICVQI